MWSYIKKAINSNLSVPLNTFISSLVGSSSDIVKTTVFGLLNQNVYAGTTLRLSSDAENSTSISSSAGQPGNVLKRVRVSVNGEIKISVDVKTSVSAQLPIIFSKTIRDANDVIFTGTYQNIKPNEFCRIDGNYTSSYVTQTITIPVKSGEEIAIYGVSAGSAITLFARNFRVYYDYNPSDTVLL